MYGLLYNYSCVATFIFIVFHIRRKLNFLANSIGKKLLHVFSYRVRCAYMQCAKVLFYTPYNLRTRAYVIFGSTVAGENNYFKALIQLSISAFKGGEGQGERSALFARSLP